MKNPGSQINNLFLLGAGFTKAVFPDAPLNKGLLAVLCKGTPCTTLKKYRKKYKTDDIEILLTHLDLEILQPKQKKQIALQQVRKIIEQQLAEYFEQFRFKKEVLKENNWLESFVKLFNENDAIISLNYDCFLEGLLDYHNVWSPNKGYGAVEVDVPGSSMQKLQNPKNILIYKIHGSENFQTTSIDMKDVDPKKISLVVRQGKIYPKSGANSCLGVVQGRPYIIAPSFVKIPYPQIHLMTTEALKAAAMAKNFVIIGCGLRPEDSHLWLFVTAFIYYSKNHGKLIIVDPEADKIKSKICDYFKVLENIINIKSGIESAVDKVINKLNER